MTRAEIIEPVLKSKWFRGIVRDAYVQGQVDAYWNNITGALGNPWNEAERYAARVTANELEPEAEG